MPLSKLIMADTAHVCSTGSQLQQREIGPEIVTVFGGNRGYFSAHDANPGSVCSSVWKRLGDKNQSRKQGKTRGFSSCFQPRIRGVFLHSAILMQLNLPEGATDV